MFKLIMTGAAIEIERLESERDDWRKLAHDLRDQRDNLRKLLKSASFWVSSEDGDEGRAARFLVTIEQALEATKQR